MKPTAAPRFGSGTCAGAPASGSRAVLGAAGAPGHAHLPAVMASLMQAGVTAPGEFTALAETVSRMGADELELLEHLLAEDAADKKSAARPPAGPSRAGTQAVRATSTAQRRPVGAIATHPWWGEPEQGSNPSGIRSSAALRDRPAAAAPRNQPCVPPVVVWRDAKSNSGSGDTDTSEEDIESLVRQIMGDTGAPMPRMELAASSSARDNHFAQTGNGRVVVQSRPTAASRDAIATRAHAVAGEYRPSSTWPPTSVSAADLSLLESSIRALMSDDDAVAPTHTLVATRAMLESLPARPEKFAHQAVEKRDRVSVSAPAPHSVRLGEVLIDVPPSLGAKYNPPAVGRNVSIAVNPSLSASSGSGAGILTGVNLCTGAQVFDTIAGAMMYFRTLSAGPGISIIQDSPNAGCIEITSGSGGGPPLDLELFINAVTGDDVTGDGSLAAPFATLDRALTQVRIQGWERTASITIENTSPPLALPKGTTNLDPGSIGNQAYPLVIQGGQRTRVAATTVASVSVDSDFSTNGSQMVTITPATPTGAVPGQIVHFTSGPLTAFDATVVSTNLQQVDAWVAAVGVVGGPTSLTLVWNSAFGTPNNGDTFVVEDIGTQVVLPDTLADNLSTSFQSNGAQITFYNLEFIASNGSNPCTGNTAIAFNSVRITSVGNGQCFADFNGATVTSSTAYTQTTPSFSTLSPAVPNPLNLPPNAPNSTAGLCLNSAGTGNVALYTSNELTPAIDLGCTLMLGNTLVSGSVSMRTTVINPNGGTSGFISNNQPFPPTSNILPSCLIQNLWCFNPGAISPVVSSGNMDASFVHVTAGNVPDASSCINITGGAFSLKNALIDGYTSTAGDHIAVSLQNASSVIINQLTITGTVSAMVPIAINTLSCNGINAATVTITNAQQAFTATTSSGVFSGVSVLECGAALYALNSQFIFDSTTVDGCGLVLDQRGGSMAFTTSMLVGDEIPNTGGISVIQAGSLLISGIVQIANTGTVGGSVLSVTEGSTLYLAGATISDVPAGGGDVIHADGAARLTILSSTIAGGPSGGRALTASLGSSVTLDGVSLSVDPSGTGDAVISVSDGTTLTARNSDISSPAGSSGIGATDAIVDWVGNTIACVGSSTGIPVVLLRGTVGVLQGVTIASPINNCIALSGKSSAYGAVVSISNGSSATQPLVTMNENSSLCFESCALTNNSTATSILVQQASVFTTAATTLTAGVTGTPGDGIIVERSTLNMSGGGVSNHGGRGIVISGGSTFWGDNATIDGNVGDAVVALGGGTLNLTNVVGTSTGAGTYGVHLGATGDTNSGNGCTLRYDASVSVTGAAGNFAAETSPPTTSTWGALGTNNDYSAATVNNIQWSLL